MSFCSDSMCNMYRYPFSIAAECGNNAFSYDARKQKEIFVSSLIHAPLTEMKQGEHIAFSELDEDGVEANCLGLANFIRQGKFFLFDNHNHCYYFYKHFLRENKIEAMDLVHVDQHKDMRRPAKMAAELGEKIDLERECFRLGITPERFSTLKNNYGSTGEFETECLDFLYTQTELHVGNFIVPLLEEGRIANLRIVDSQYTMQNFLKEDLSERYALDLDLDFFAKEMDYIDRKQKIEFVCDLMCSASAVFIASSPYFISFEDAHKALSEICERFSSRFK